METPPRTKMASYLERWEEQKMQSRIQRQKQQRRRSSDVGDELSFISAIERETAQQERYDDQMKATGRLYVGETNDSFNLPDMDAFPPSEFVEQPQEQQKMPTDDEFVDAATFLKKNELGGDDSFSEDVEAHQVNSTGRPSDFFESKSRNLDHVELSSPTNVDNPLFYGEEAEDEVEETGMCTPKQQLSPTDLRHGVALHDRFDRNSGLSGSGTAFSSGYDIHFDNAKLMYTPNSLKYLQEKSRVRSAGERLTEVEYIAGDHTGEAEAVTKKTPSLPDQDVVKDPSPEYVAALQRGPGVIKESLHEIDALIDNSIRLASAPATKDPLGVELPEDVRAFVRDYERPLESMLPLSRTTDSWGEDISISQIDDDASRRSRDFEQLLPNGTDLGRKNSNGIRRSRSQESPELDTIREVPCASNTDSGSRSQCSDNTHTWSLKARQSQNRYFDQLVGGAGHEQRNGRSRMSPSTSNQLSRNICSDDNVVRSDDPKSTPISTALDESLAKVAATQNPFRDEVSKSKPRDNCLENDFGGSLADTDDIEKDGYTRNRINSDQVQDAHVELEPDYIDLNNVRFRYGEDARKHLRSDSTRQHVDRKHRAVNELDSRTKQQMTSDRVLDMLERNKLHVTMETRMVPRRCRRFLCSVGDIMTEQIVFTNGSNSVGRICVSLLPLSTGCQQFSVSPAVLELGPKASSAFHVTFNARYAGAVSGIFQFRGVGVESLFHPYEVVIEASVKRHLELEAPRKTRANQPCEEADFRERVQELQASSSVDRVEISPTFIRFDRVRSKRGETTIRKAKLRLSNNTAQMLPFKVRALENLRVRPAAGMIQPASEVIVSVLPISQPFVHQREGGETISSSPSPRTENWFGSLTVCVGKSYLREVSVVVDRRAIQMLPPFDEIARSRHQLSSQTDSFYYTKRGKRRGLYFHARAVEFGCCNVGEAHEVPVYICNGSKAPMTVFLQELQEPYSCAYSTTTIEPRKFIEVMVTFTPKVVGKVATSLFAYSVTDKAVVTLVARGI